MERTLFKDNTTSVLGDKDHRKGDKTGALFNNALLLGGFADTEYVSYEWV